MNNNTIDECFNGPGTSAAPTKQSKDQELQLSQVQMQNSLNRSDDGTTQTGGEKTFLTGSKINCDNTARNGKLFDENLRHKIVRILKTKSTDAINVPLLLLKKEH